MDRLAMLRQMAERTPNEPFVHYGIALELRKQGRHEEAVAAFEHLCTVHASYVPTYLMFGNLLREMGQQAAAAAVFERGIVAADAAGDHHAQSELRSARAELA